MTATFWAVPPAAVRLIVTVVVLPMAAKTGTSMATPTSLLAEALAAISSARTTIDNRREIRMRHHNDSRLTRDPSLLHCAARKMFPERLRSSFSPATLNTLEVHEDRFVVAEPLFFRSAYTANVTENRRRSFSPVVVLNASGASSARCTCAPDLKPGDLCRHIAALVTRCTDATGILLAERFESSLWRAVGFELFTERRELDVDGTADPRELLLRKLTMTEQEGELLRRGAASTRLQWEASACYRWAKRMFTRFGEGEGARLEERGGHFHLVAGDAALVLPASAVEHVITVRGGAIAVASGFAVAPQSLTPSLHIELTAERALRFVPVLIEKQRVHIREALPRFGKFFLLPPGSEKREGAAAGGR